MNGTQSPESIYDLYQMIRVDSFYFFNKKCKDLLEGHYY